MPDDGAKLRPSTKAAGAYSAGFRKAVQNALKNNPARLPALVRKRTSFIAMGPSSSPDSISCLRDRLGHIQVLVKHHTDHDELDAYPRPQSALNCRVDVTNPAASLTGAAACYF